MLKPMEATINLTPDQAEVQRFIARLWHESRTIELKAHERIMRLRAALDQARSSEEEENLYRRMEIISREAHAAREPIRQEIERMTKALVATMPPMPQFLVIAPR